MGDEEVAALPRSEQIEMLRQGEMHSDRSDDILHGFSFTARCAIQLCGPDKR